jgi:hypothetical protein
MSIKVMTEVWEHSKAKSTDLLVLLALADMANDEGECWPSMSTIGRKCRINTRNARARIYSLKNLGEVVVIESGGKSSSKGGVRSNRYRITVHMDDPDTVASDLVAATDPVAGDLQTRSQETYRTRSLATAEPSLEPSMNPLAPAGADAEERFALRASILEVCRLDPGSVTPSAEGAIAKAVKDIADVGGTAEMIPNAANTYQQRFPSATITPSALAKHWPALISSRPNEAILPRQSEADKVGVSVARRTADLEEAKALIADECYDDCEEALAAWSRTVEHERQRASF